MLERRGQQQVLLEAVAAAPLMHELTLEILLGKRYRNSAMRIEVSNGIEVAWARWTACSVGRSPALSPTRSTYAAKSSIPASV